MPPQPEQEARREIDRLLTAAGTPPPGRESIKDQSRDDYAARCSIAGAPYSPAHPDALRITTHT
jgi:hypothetical protein